MPIENIPAIREDYPLFSWDDHKESFAALKKGGEVAGFKKETWNAIIDKLQAVLTESGLSWDKSSYTTAENAKITEAYGALSAAMFNAVRHNIDHPIPVGWKWANDSTFRGYVGRKDFRGYADYGTQCDLFYAEYLIEIVRKLNLLIEMLRGTAPFSDFENQCNIESRCDVNLQLIPTVPISAEEKSSSTASGKIVLVPSVPLSAEEKSQSLAKSNMALIPLIPIEYSKIIKSQNKADMFIIKCVGVGAEETAKTEHSANLEKVALKMIDASALSSSITAVSLSSARLEEMFAMAKSSSLHHAEADSIQSVQIGAESRVKSLQYAELNQAETHPISAADGAKSSERATVELVPSIQIKATETAKTTQSAKIEKVPTKRVGAAEKSASVAAVTLDFAWIPPIRNGTNLYIRQVYDMERNGNDLRLI